MTREVNGGRILDGGEVSAGTKGKDDGIRPARKAAGLKVSVIQDVKKRHGMMKNTKKHDTSDDIADEKGVKC